MSTDNLRMRVQMLEASNARLERERKQYWAVPMVGGAVAKSSLYIVTGGNVLTYLNAPGPGIIRRLDTIAASELPNGVAGTGVIVVPPNASMPGLPNGIGVAQQYDGTALTWVILDAGTSAAVPDLIGNNDVILTATTYVFDKVSGPTTWRYNCIRPVAGWW